MFDVSNNAINRIREISLKEKQKYFRISVDGGGCQGFSYKFDFDQNIKTNDKLFKFNDIEVIIDDTSLGFLKGSQLDFVNDMIGSYFKITNPNASSTCGCGTSFSV
ncbi:MAG: iron-sulfur cluster assembly accessory protein [Rickettsiales bacterium]|nr:iron-sulfur cluster assembly accessory protein [Rickettsiales bacterium]|tara:strand:+ start:1061 stop:1378 length:318 start_codon:yes stop_codon:yes gene_type:complete